VSSPAWAALGFVVFGFVLPGSSATDGLAIALFLFLVPWLLCGSLALLVRQRRQDQRTIGER
jgi:hypothetical protein